MIYESVDHDANREIPVVLLCVAFDYYISQIITKEKLIFFKVDKYEFWYCCCFNHSTLVAQINQLS